MIKIRGHHIFCILTFIGKGYSKEFISNMHEIINNISNEEKVKIIIGPDDICQPCLEKPQCHCFNFSEKLRDILALMIASCIVGAFLYPGREFKFHSHSISKLRIQYAKRSSISCSACQWRDLCREVAEKGYENTTLKEVEPQDATRRQRIKFFS